MVVRGEYELIPIDEQQPCVEVFAQRRVENGPPQVQTTFAMFLRFLGEWLDMPVVNEVEMSPEVIRWRIHDVGARADEDRIAAEERILALLNLTAQTNLEFRIEPRKMPLLFVEREKRE